MGEQERVSRAREKSSRGKQEQTSWKLRRRRRGGRGAKQADRKERCMRGKTASYGKEGNGWELIMEKKSERKAGKGIHNGKK